MKPRGRPFEPGNKMGRGRPKGSRNKSMSAEQQLLEQWRLPMIAQCIRKASEGHFPSLRLYISLYKSLPHKRSIRSGNMQSAEDLLKVGEATMQQMDRGEITVVEAKTKMQGIEQMGHLLEQSAQEKKSQRPPKQIMPDFLLEFIQREKEEHEKLLAQDRAERKALAWDAANHLEGE